MSLPGSPMSVGPPRWAPTHVQVTVLQARGLRSKAKGSGKAGGGGASAAGGGSDAYAVMALGKEKFATSVSERCLGAPVWREEATFELPPRRGPGPGPPAVLQLTVLHRALLGLDKFLGRVEINLAELQSEGGRRTTRWYTLHSKPGKKEKERGEIEVDVQFMRSNMTASMFDLSMKDKSRNPLGKLKDKLKGKRGNGLPDTASAIIPSISHSPADSDEESNEKEKEKKKKSKFKTLFSKPGLQKSNVSQSMSVLPTLQPVSEKVRLRPSDFSSQWGDDDDDDDDTLTPVSEKPSANKGDNNSLYPPSGMSHKRTGSADSKQLSQIASSSKKDTLSLFGGLKSKNDPASRSNVCINGSHVYVEHDDTQSDILSKDGTPLSPSPLTSRQKRLFLSQENLSSESAKEPDVTEQHAAGKEPPESSSLESFKAMTLPSYKLLSGDFLESSTPMTLDILKETKETKKQENKKSGLLSLVTGKKEAKASEEVESGSDVSLKQKEVKREEKESTRKETNPFEVPGEGRRNPSSDKSSVVNISIAKAPNRFDVVEEQKPEKSTAPVKPSQTKPVKPRVGVSSEDETKAALTIPEPSCVSPSFSSRLFSNNNNPFTSDLGSEVKTQGSDSFGGLPLNLSSPHDNNPFAVKWDQESKQDSESFTASPFCLPSLASGKENNPFAPHWRQESQMEDSGSSTKSLLYLSHPPTTSVVESHPIPSQLPNVDSPFDSKQGEASEHINNPPMLLSSPPVAFSQEPVSSAGSPVDSKKHPIMPLEKPQNEGITNQADPISILSKPLSGSHPAHFCDQVGLIPKTQYDDQDVNVVAPLKGNKGSVKKSVTFAVVEREDDPVSSGDEMSEEDSAEGWQDENEDAEDRMERNEGLGLERERCSVSRSYIRIGSAAYSGEPLEKQAETSSPGKIEVPVPTPRVVMLSPKEASLPRAELSGSSLSVPPKPAPRSTLKQDKLVALPLTDAPEKDEGSSTSELGLPVDNPCETLANANSLTTSVSTELPSGQDGGGVESSQSINGDRSSCGISTMPAVPITGDLNLKPAALPVIPEVGSDDEQLSDSQKGAETADVCEAVSRTSDCSSELWSSVEGRDLASNKKATDKQSYLLLERMTGLNDDTLESSKALINTLAAGLQNVSRSVGGSELKGEVKESRQSDCSEPSDRPTSLSSLSSSALPHPTSSFQSEALGSDRAESPKKTTAEGLDAKVEISGKKKLLQAWVSPSETQPSQDLQSGGTRPAKLRLHPVKPMNATANKPSAKTLTIDKILDNQNEANLKKYNPSDPAYAYAQLTHDELIQLVLKQKDVIAKRDHQVRELEDYIDNLLVRVMEETPNILRVQNRGTKKAGKM